MKKFQQKDKVNQNQQDTPLSLGIKPVRELLENSPSRVEWVYIRKGQNSNETRHILDLCSLHGIKFSLVTDDVLKRLSSSNQKVNNQGVVAKIREGEAIAFEDILIDAFHAPLPLIVALDSVQDPGNVGTLARTLYALGGGGIVMPIHNSASLNIGAKKSAAGALDFLPVTKVTNLARSLEDASQAGYTIYSTTLDKNFTEQEEKKDTKQKNNNPLPVFNALLDENKLSFPAVLVLGGEDKGIRPNVHKRCDAILQIPMQRSFDSLNVAQAGGILISAFLRAKLSSK